MKKKLDEKSFSSLTLFFSVACSCSEFIVRASRYLLHRLKETTFIIAKEITLKKIVDSKLPYKTVAQLAVNQDYRKAIEIITIIEQMQKASSILELDYQGTNILSTFMAPIGYQISGRMPYFINWKLNDLLIDMLTK